MLIEEFKQLTGFGPAEHQAHCLEALAQGKSVILRAPTGSGKSEAVWIPFLLARGQPLPMRMIHILPMQALVNQLESRIGRYIPKLKPNQPTEIRTAAMHGKRPESVLFYADAIFATLDQVVTSYACAPLSLSVRQGNIPAGAIPGSFLVFDEVHTFEPALGLQSALVLGERAAKMAIPFVIMSATLPQDFLVSLRERFGRDHVEIVNGQRVPAIDGPERHVTLEVRSEPLTAQAVLTHAQASKKVLVVVNTVQRAIDLFEEVRQAWDGRTLLAHSRFYDDDRQSKERDIESLFGKEAVIDRCLLIATQVVEVGLDISCDLLLTDIAPIDALVQRIGRCARWGGRGRVIAFTELETTRPYDEKLVADTVVALRDRNYDCRDRELTWDDEKTLVDNVLGPYFERWAEPNAAGRVLASLAEAVFTGDSNKAAGAVRDALAVEVALHDVPQNLGPGVLRLPRCRLHPGGFQQFIREQKPQVWQIVVDRNPADDYVAKIDPVPVNHNSRLIADGVYIVHPQYACYDSDFGLRLGVSGTPANPIQTGETKGRLESTLEPELWQVHIAKVVKNFEQQVLPKERVGFEALARWLGKTSQELLAIAKLVLIFHDLGKLTRAWQERIKAGLNLPSSLFLAHRGGDIKGLPPHATVSAWIATDCIRRVASPEWEETLALPALAAVAHHHSVRSDMVPNFEMAEGWFDVIADCTRRLAGIKVEEEDFNTKGPRGSGSSGVCPNFLLPEGYTSYVLLSRWLRLADRIATGGGEGAILSYEDWMRRG